MPSSQQWVGILIASAGLGQRGYVVCQYIVQEAPILIHMYVVCFSCIGRDHTGTHDWRFNQGGFGSFGVAEWLKAEFCHRKNWMCVEQILHSIFVTCQVVPPFPPMVARESYTNCRRVHQDHGITLSMQEAKIFSLLFVSMNRDGFWVIVCVVKVLAWLQSTTLIMLPYVHEQTCAVSSNWQKVRTLNVSKLCSLHVLVYARFQMKCVIQTTRADKHNRRTSLSHARGASPVLKFYSVTWWDIENGVLAGDGRADIQHPMF